MISVYFNSTEILSEMIRKSTDLPLTFRLHAKNVRKDLPSFYLCKNPIQTLSENEEIEKPWVGRKFN